MALAQSSPFRDGFVQAVGPAVVGGFGDEAALIDWLEVWRTDDLFEPFPQPPSAQQCFSPEDSSPGILSSPPILVQDDLARTSSFPVVPTLFNNFTPTEQPISRDMVPVKLETPEEAGIIDLREFYMQELEVHNARRTQLQQALEKLNETPLADPTNGHTPTLDTPELQAQPQPQQIQARVSLKRGRFEPVVPKSTPPAKHSTLTETTLQHTTPPSILIIDTPECPFPKYAQRSRPVTPAPFVELAGVSFGPGVDLRSLGIYIQVLCSDSTPLAGFVGESTVESSSLFTFSRLVFPTSSEAPRNRGARVHPGEQKHIYFQARTQHPSPSAATIAQIPVRQTSIFLYDHSKWFPSPEISLISNPIVEIGKETEIHVYGQWFISHEEETSNQGRLRITILDMDGGEQKVAVVNAKSNHHFSFVHSWSQPCTVWVQVHNEFKHRSSFKTRQSPRRTHRSTILVVPDRAAYFSWVRGTTAPGGEGGSGSGHSEHDGDHGSHSASSQGPHPGGSGAGGKGRGRGSGGSGSGCGGGLSDDSTSQRQQTIGTPTRLVSELMHSAARHNDLPSIHKQLASGANPFAVDFHGQTALHSAVQFGNAAILRALLSWLKTRVEQRRLLRLRDSWGLTALHRACLFDDAASSYEMVRNILCLESDPHSSYLTDEQFSPLHAAILKGHEHVAALLLQSLWRSKPSLNQQSIDGMGLIHLAVNSSMSSALPLLLRLGCNINALDYNSESALFYAVRQPHSRMVAELLTLGAVFNTVNSAGESLLDVAHPSHFTTLLRLSEPPRQLILAASSSSSSSSSSSTQQISDARVKLVGSTLRKITNEQNASQTDRPRSFGRRNLSVPSLNELIGLNEEIAPEHLIDRLDIRIDEDLLKDPILFDDCPMTNMSTEKQAPPSPAPKRNKQRRGSASLSSSQATSFVPIPSLFGILNAVPPKKTKARTRDQPESRAKEQPEAKKPESRKHSGLKALLTGRTRT